LPQGWLTEKQSSVVLLSTNIGLDRILFGFYLLTSSSVFQSASVAGRTQQQFQPCGKPRPLAVIMELEQIQ
jgi:hypothetical protein